MRQGELPQGGTAGRGEANQNFALIVDARMTRDGAGVLESVDQFDGAVVLDEEARGDFANGRFYVFGEAVDSEEELVLLWLDSVFFRGGLTEVEETPDLAAELGELAVLVAAEVVTGLHIYIVARYKPEAAPPDIAARYEKSEAAPSGPVKS